MKLFIATMLAMFMLSGCLANQIEPDTGQVSHTVLGKDVLNGHPTVMVDTYTAIGVKTVDVTQEVYDSVEAGQICTFDFEHMKNVTESRMYFISADCTGDQ